MARYSGEVIASTSLEIRENLALLDRLISFGLGLAFFPSGPIVNFMLFFRRTTFDNRSRSEERVWVHNQDS